MAKLSRGGAQLAVAEICVAQTVAKGPLACDVGLVVVCAGHDAGDFRHFVVVGRQGVDVAGIGVGQTAAEVGVAREEVGQGVAAFVAGQEYVDDCGSQGLDVGDDARTALVEHQHDGLAGRGGHAHELFLSGREVEVGEVAGGLAV